MGRTSGTRDLGADGNGNVDQRFTKRLPEHRTGGNLRRLQIGREFRRPAADVEPQSTGNPALGQPAAEFAHGHPAVPERNFSPHLVECVARHDQPFHSDRDFPVDQAENAEQQFVFREQDRRSARVPRCGPARRPALRWLRLAIAPAGCSCDLVEVQQLGIDAA